MKYYTGVGSRDTPEPILITMTALAQQLRKAGWYLRSGGAEGADTAFEWAYPTTENGQLSAKQIFLPWERFNGHMSPYFLNELGYFKAVEVLKKTGICSHFNRLSQGAQKLHARNVFQILGPNLDPNEASQFVVCWTQEGQVKGGTATAIKLAQYFQIPVFNFGNMTLEYIAQSINILTEKP